MTRPTELELQREYVRLLNQWRMWCAIATAAMLVLGVGMLVYSIQHCQSMGAGPNMLVGGLMSWWGYVITTWRATVEQRKLLALERPRAD